MLENLKLGIYEKGIPLAYDWDRKFEVAKEAGFDFIEFSIDGLKPRIDRLDWSDDEYQRIYEISLKHNMPFKTMALTANRYFPLGDPDESVRLKGQKIVLRAIDIAAILKIEIIQIAAYDVNGKTSSEETIKNFFDSMILLVDYAKTKGVKLAIEVLEDVPFFSSIEKATAVLNDLNHPDIYLYADTGNTASIGIEPSNDLRYDENRILACHVKDALIDNCRNVPYGTGLVDFEKCMTVFKEKNYNGYFVAEVWCDEDEGFVPYLKEVASFIRKYTKGR